MDLDGRRVLASEGQYLALDALVHAGTYKEAAEGSEETRRSLERRLYKLRRRTGLTTVQLAFCHGRGNVDIQMEFWALAA